MTLDVVVPVLRTKTVGRLLHSLARGTSRPDAVTLVSNEVPLDVEAYGLPVRVIRFRSDTVPTGYKDVALRRDIGIWASACRHVVTLDDDLVASASLVAASRDLLRARPYFWGTTGTSASLIIASRTSCRFRPAGDALANSRRTPGTCG